MKLVRYIGYEVKPSEELMLLKCFRKLWNRDRSKNKDKALSEIGFIYFHYDPRSDYMFITNERERFERIVEDTGLDSNWKPDELLTECIETYVKNTNTTVSGLLEDTRYAIEAVRVELRNINMKEEDSKGRRVHTIKSVTETAAKVPELMEKFAKAEELMNRELFEKESRVRGQAEKKIMEDGFI